MNISTINNKSIETQKVMPDEIQTNPFLNLKEACNFLKVSSSLLYKLTSNKKIKYFKPTGRLIYFDREDLINFIKSNPIVPIETDEVEHTSFEINNDFLKVLKKRKNKI